MMSVKIEEHFIYNALTTLVVSKTVDMICKINSKIKVTMIHGKKDEVVPVSFSRLVLSVFKNAKKKLMKIVCALKLTILKKLRIFVKD